MTTRGALCQNPMNVMDNPAITWEGQVRPTLDPEKRLCTFDNQISGIRAAAIILLSYYLHDSCDTPTTVINRWAPPSDSNPTQAYIDFMCKYCGVSANDALVMTNGPFLNKWVAGQIRFEQGFDICTPATIAQGVIEALAHD